VLSLNCEVKNLDSVSDEAKNLRKKRALKPHQQKVTPSTKGNGDKIIKTKGLNTKS